MAEVILKNVSKIYEGKNLAVKNANIEINDKEFVVVVGPSGCGKSTVLRMIAGLEEITSGEIYIDDKLVNNISPKDRDIAMVFQNYALYPHMTVFENIAFGLKLRKFNTEEIKQRVEEAVVILGLQDYLDRRPKQLSGGQRQRVAVGRAIVRKPKVFLFDEPLSNLDAKLRVQMRTEISKLHKNLGATMIYVTHDQTEAMTMGDRIVILKDGVVQQTGTPMELYNKPVNKFVAGFIGSPSMNFMKGQIIQDNGLQFVSSSGELKLQLTGAKSSALKDYLNRTVEIGIRPEHFKIAQPNLPSAVNVKLDVVEPMGNESFLYFQLEGHQLIARLSPTINFKAGEQTHLQLQSESIYFFDSVTGEYLAS